MGTRVPTIYVLSKNKKNIKFFLQKIFFFYSYKNLCILHGQVFVMIQSISSINVFLFVEKFSFNLKQFLYHSIVNINVSGFTIPSFFS